MESKLKVVILGTDQKLLKTVADKINSSRPVEVTYFTDLKDFLAHTVTDKPDLACVSVTYPHKSASRFPKVFKMALNTPVITFGEKQDGKTRKLMAVATGDYKISSVINAHNLWIKILSYKKDMEQAENGQTSRAAGYSGNKINIQSSATFLKGKSYEPNAAADSGSLLNSLMAELNDSNLKSELGINHIQSGQESQSQKKRAQSLNNGSELANPAVGSAGGDSQSSATTGMVDHDEEAACVANSGVLSENEGTGGSTTDTSGITHAKGKVAQDSNSGNSSSNMSAEDSADDNKTSNSMNEEGSSVSAKGVNSDNKNNSNKKTVENPDQSPKDKRNAKHDSSNAEKNQSSSKSDPGLNDQKKKKTGNIEQTNSKDSKPKENNPNNEKNKQNRSGGTNNQGIKPETNHQDPSSQSKNGNLGQTAKKKPETSNGPLKNAKKNQDRRIDRVTKRSAEAQQVINWLQEACELSLQENLKAKVVSASDYKSRKIHVFIVELGKTKGFLFLTTSRKQSFDANLLSGLRKAILTQASLRGHSLEISTDFVLEIDMDETNSFMDSFCDFLTVTEDQEGGRFSFSFVEREEVRPSFEDSDKEDMYFIDVKVIPPRTVVNFDAFLYLPRNQRFVRYLKEGRYLSLEQAARHAENSANHRMYLPKNHKAKFIQFFISNTINWEYMLYLDPQGKEEAA